MNLWMEAKVTTMAMQMKTKGTHYFKIQSQDLVRGLAISIVDICNV